MLTATILLAMFAASAMRPLIVSRSPYPFAPWDSLTRADHFVKRHDYEATAHDAAFAFERITHASDSLAGIPLPEPHPARHAARNR